MRPRRLPRFNDLTALARLFEFRSVSRWVGLGLGVGVISGLSAAAFFALIELAQHAVLHQLAHFEPVSPRGERSLFDASLTGARRWWMVAMAPALGGIVSSVLLWRFSRHEKIHGTDALIDAFHRGTPIHTPTTLLRLLASACVIGTGGSAGREGPMAHVGAAWGALFGGWLKMSARERRLLLLAGAASGIGAIFQSPLGAALFVLEVLYEDDFEVDGIVPTVLASVVGYSVFTLIFGRGTIFVTAGEYDFNPLELPFYLVMAAGAALVGWCYVRFYRAAQLAWFPRIPIHPLLLPPLGGLCVGAMALVIPQSLGAGYGWLQEALLPTSDRLPGGWVGAAVLLGIAFAKIVTTTLTVGTGGAGGLFGPTAVIGGMTGGAFGLAFHQIAPSIVSQPASFVLVGMACFLGGVAKAPISTLVMASEMTGSYDLLVPLMLAEVVTYAMSRRFSLFRSQVRTRRESPAHGGEYVLDVLQDVSVGDVFDREAAVVPVEPETPVVELLRRASESKHAVFPVVSVGGEVRGIVTMNTLRAALVDPDLQRFAIAEDCASPFVSIAPTDTLGAALERFAVSHYPELPVVSPNAPGRILGLLSYEDLLEAYSRELARRQAVAVASEPPPISRR